MANHSRNQTYDLKVIIDLIPIILRHIFQVAQCYELRVTTMIVNGFDYTSSLTSLSEE